MNEDKFSNVWKKYWLVRWKRAMCEKGNCLDSPINIICPDCEYNTKHDKFIKEEKDHD